MDKLKIAFPQNLSTLCTKTTNIILILNIFILFQEHLSKHDEDKAYKCDVCPKQFNHQSDLRRHMCLHTGEKPFICAFCGKGFIRKDRKVKHEENHKKKASHMPEGIV